MMVENGEKHFRAYCTDEYLWMMVGKPDCFKRMQCTCSFDPFRHIEFILALNGLGYTGAISFDRMDSDLGWMELAVFGKDPEECYKRFRDDLPKLMKEYLLTD